MKDERKKLLAKWAELAIHNASAKAGVFDLFYVSIYNGKGGTFNNGTKIK